MTIPSTHLVIGVDIPVIGEDHRGMTQTTTSLIAEYDARIVSRFDHCALGSTRHASRQAKINAIVDELSQRADAGDSEAEAWFAL